MLFCISYVATVCVYNGSLIVTEYTPVGLRLVNPFVADIYQTCGLYYNYNERTFVTVSRRESEFNSLNCASTFKSLILRLHASTTTKAYEYFRLPTVPWYDFTNSGIATLSIDDEISWWDSKPGSHGQKANYLTTWPRAHSVYLIMLKMSAFQFRIESQKV